MAFFAIALLASACLDEPDCVASENTTTIRFSFRKLTGGVDTISFEFVNIISGDQVFVTEPLEDISTLDLTVNPTDTTTTFVFQQSGQVSANTLVLRYDPVARLISPECGVETLVQNLGIIEQDFDSISILKPDLEEFIETNVQIFN